jgi:hypothetical protein
VESLTCISVNVHETPGEGAPPVDTKAPGGSCIDMETSVPFARVLAKAERGSGIHTSASTEIYTRTAAV